MAEPFPHASRPDIYRARSAVCCRGRCGCDPAGLGMECERGATIYFSGDYVNLFKETKGIKGIKGTRGISLPGYARKGPMLRRSVAASLSCALMLAAFTALGHGLPVAVEQVLKKTGIP